MPLPAGQGAFLLGADLNAPDVTVAISRRKKQRLFKSARAEKQNEELAAEKGPRISGQRRWLEDERKRTKLPTADGGADVSKQAQAHAKREAADMALDGAVGRKKAKRMAELERKKSQKAAKKAAAGQKTYNQAVAALASKVPKKGQLSPAAADLMQRLQRDATSEQRLLALVAEQVAAEPEKELSLFDIFFELHATGANLRTKQLALLSAVAVFKDLVPGYRIREPTEVDKATVRSKGVLATERHELALLQVYRRLLPMVEAGMKSYPKVVAPAVAALVKAASDFNYRQRLITSAVKYANSENDEVRRTVSLGLQEMVEADQRLEASKEVVTAIGNSAQAAAAGRGGRSLKTELLTVLLRLPIGRAEAAELNQDTSVAADDDVKREMAEASISHTAEFLKKAEATLLYEVFVVYLRILRQRGVHNREVISGSMVGLAKWGREVNLELLLEILAELKHAVLDAIGQADELVALQGLNCALVLLSGPSQALITDATWLADACTRALALALPSLHSTHSESESWPPERCFVMEGDNLHLCKKEMAAALDSESVPALVLRCLDNAMRCPHGFGRASDSAIASLLETLFLLAASADSHVALALLKEGAAILKRNYRLHTLLDTEGGLFGLGGITDRAVSVAWQLHPLGCSLSPAPAKVGRGLAATVKSRRALLAELFPARDSKAWLESEFPQHLASLLEAPVPAGLAIGGEQRAQQQQSRKAAAKALSSASFCSEAELRTMLGVRSMP